VSTAENKDLIPRIFAGVEIGDGLLLFESMAEDFRWIIPGSTKWSRTYEAGGGRQRTHSAAAPQDRRRDQEEGALRIIADGDLVAVEARGDNMTKSGMPYRNAYCFVFRLEDGKLKEVTEYQDTELATRALGDPGE
jgi:ketosteroid isomerase-like protein